MIDAMPPANPDLAVPTPFAPPPAAPSNRRRWILLGVTLFTILVVSTFAVFAFGVVGASAAGGCGGP